MFTYRYWFVNVLFNHQPDIDVLEISTFYGEDKWRVSYFIRVSSTFYVYNKHIYDIMVIFYCYETF